MKKVLLFIPAIALLLHQAFIVSFVLAGVCGKLLAETRNKVPDPKLCKNLESLLPVLSLPEKNLPFEIKGPFYI